MKTGKFVYIYIYQLTPPETLPEDGRNQIIFELPTDIKSLIQTKHNLKSYVRDSTVVEFLKLYMYRNVCSTDNNYPSGATVGTQYNGTIIIPIQ